MVYVFPEPAWTYICPSDSTNVTRRRTRLAVGHDCGISPVEDALDEFLRRVRVDAVLRRRFVEDDVKFKGLLVVGRF